MMYWLKANPNKCQKIKITQGIYFIYNINKIKMNSKQVIRKSENPQLLFQLTDSLLNNQ